MIAINAKSLTLGPLSLHAATIPGVVAEVAMQSHISAAASHVLAENNAIDIGG